MTEFIRPETSEDVLSNPHKWGFVTFDEYKRNRDRWVGRDDDTFASAEKGSIILNKRVRKHIYEVEGYRCRSLEECEKVASNMGIQIRDLVMCPELTEASAGRFDVLVRFFTKETKAKRESWR